MVTRRYRDLGRKSSAQIKPSEQLNADQLSLICFLSSFTNFLNIKINLKNRTKQRKHTQLVTSGIIHKKDYGLINNTPNTRRKRRKCLSLAVKPLCQTSEL
jgi:recombinational DNA repair ATPase RecF